VSIRGVREGYREGGIGILGYWHCITEGGFQDEMRGMGGYTLALVAFVCMVFIVLFSVDKLVRS
jgi:hypothetical protein